MSRSCQAGAMRRRIAARWNGLGAAGRGLLATLGLVLVAGAVAAAILFATGTFSGEEAPTVAPQEVAEAARAPERKDVDPFAYSPERRADFVERAALGHSHVLYELSPGGIEASAARTARWRDAIEAAASRRGADPDLMEAMVLLESAGRPEVIAGADPEAASGLAQILPDTAITLLGMEVDLARSQALTAEYAENVQRIERARTIAAGAKMSAKKRRDAAKEVGELTRRNVEVLRERRSVDERFQPEAALDGMARYLALSERRFGRGDLAVVAYHMGQGNLENVIERYTGRNVDSDAIGRLVAAEDLNYAQLYFDSSPLINERAWGLLGSLGDDSSTYLWRVLAAERIMSLYREDRERLREVADLQTAKATAEELFHPVSETDRFTDPDALDDAREDGDLVRIPGDGTYGFRVGNKLGELADDLGVPLDSYRALRPAALAALIYLSERTREINGGEGKLIVTSAVRDLAYQEALTGVNPEATREYSLHTTGYSFDILRRYSNDRQAEAFQFMLDRLRSLAVLDYAVEPQAIHVTVSNGARPLLED